MNISQPSKKNYYSGRYYLLLVFLLLLVLVLFARMFYLTVSDRNFLKTQGNARSLRTVDIPAYRGMITDRNGIPLAVSTPVEAVWVNPPEFDTQDKDIAMLAKYLDMPAGVLLQRIAKAQSREFLYLKRGVDPITAAKIKELNIPGINLQREFRRYYPEGEVVAHILGFTNIDDQGQEGLELAYNEWLKGVPGKKRVLKDRLGNIISDVNQISEPRPGNNLVLSIDRRIQYIAYRELKSAVTQFEAVGGSVVVLDAHSGEILAMANQPSYNPNMRPLPKDTINALRNRAVTDLFEPGSVIKPFSIANALNSGLFHPSTMIDTNPGTLTLNGHQIVDDHHENNGVISVTGILQRSSNIGVTKMTLALPPQALWQLLHQAGFGARTESTFPGEGAGSLENRTAWSPFVLATLAFGYGLSVTTLQLAQAYSIFTNDGTLVPVSLLRVDKIPDATAVIKPTVAREMLDMLMAVVEGGTGLPAKIPGYTVGGKTGTSRIAGVKGYEKNHHNGTFVGIAPITAPRLIVVVVINDPKKLYYANQVAAPTFARIMAASLQVLDIPPDHPENAIKPGATI